MLKYIYITSKDLKSIKKKKKNFKYVPNNKYWCHESYKKINTLLSKWKKKLNTLTSE